MSFTYCTKYESASPLTSQNVNINKPNGDNNIMEYWAHSALEKQIRQGTDIRKEKPHYPRSHAYSYDLNNIDTITWKRGRKRRFRKKLNTRNNCPMRIAELATPNKRRCLETWKEKCNVLPDFIIERLKNRVLDQIPIVQIPDAVYSFKKGRTSTHVRYNKKRKYKNTKSCTKIMELRTISIIFGHKIAQQLNKSIVVKLNPRLTKLSQVVANDIASLMRKKQKCYKVDNKSSHNIEMANKITLWMAMILEDSSLKLLEDALEDLEDEEGHVCDYIDDLLENVLDICEPKLKYLDSYTTKSETSSQSRDFDDNILSKEFDEKYSLDALEHEEFEENTDHFKQEDVNEIVNNIEHFITNELDNMIYISIEKSNEHKVFYKDLNTPESQISQDQLSTESVLANDIDSKVIDMPPKVDEIQNSVMETIEILHSQDIQETKEKETQKMDLDVLNKDLAVELSGDDNILEKMDSETDLLNNIGERLNEILGEDLTNTEIMQDIPKQKEIEENNDRLENTDYVVPQDSLNIIKKISKEDVSLKSFTSDQKISQENNTYSEDILVNIEENKPNQNIDSLISKGLNVAEIFEVAPEEKSPEEMTDDKNKKVKFSNNAMVTPESLQSKKLSETYLSQDSINHETVTSKPSVDIKKSTISFSSPNEELLSDADELWPRDIASPTRRPGESVSRSITSLGKIMESDERLLISPESITEAILEDSIEVLDQSDEQIPDASETAEPTSNSLQNISTPPDAIMKGETVISHKISSEIPSLHIDTSKVKTKKTDGNKERTIKTNQMLAQKVKTNIDKNKTNRTLYKNKLHKTYKSSAPNIVTKTKQIHKAAAVDSGETNKAKKVLEEDKINKGGRKTDIKQNSALNSVEINAELPVDRIPYEEQYITENSNQNNISYNVYLKPDYKVNISTAPTWINRTSHKEFSRKRTKKDVYTNKWCNDLNNGFEHLEIWKDWINIICELILKHKRGRISSSNRGHLNEWIHMKKNIDREAYLWRKLNKHTKKKLRQIIYVCRKESEVIPVVCCSKCYY